MRRQKYGEFRLIREKSDELEIEVEALVTWKGLRRKKMLMRSDSEERGNVAELHVQLVNLTCNSNKLSTDVDFK
jgi:hypothetical protein